MSTGRYPGRTVQCENTHGYYSYCCVYSVMMALYYMACWSITLAIPPPHASKHTAAGVRVDSLGGVRYAVEDRSPRPGRRTQIFPVYHKDCKVCILWEKIPEKHLKLAFRQNLIVLPAESHSSCRRDSKQYHTTYCFQFV